MAAHSHAMTDSKPDLIEKLINSTPGRLGLIVLSTIVWAGIIPLIFFINDLVPAWLLKWATIGLIGLIAGLVSRRLLSENTFILRMLAACVAVICSLWLLKWVTWGFIGFDPLQQPTLGFNWEWLGQTIFALFTAFLVLKAGRVTLHPKKPARKPSQKRSPSSKERTSKNKPPKKGRSNGSLRSVKTKTSASRPRSKRPVASGHPAGSQKNWTLQRLGDQLGNKLTGLQTRFETKSRAAWASGQTLWLGLQNQIISGSKQAKVQLPRGSQRSKPLPGKSAKIRAAKKENAAVRFFGQIEHRCPYCLEPVEKGDSRGIKVCPTCKTCHHADCWDVTGACQVPHYQE